MNMPDQLDQSRESDPPQGNESDLEWGAILRSADPKVREGAYNTDRKKLLRPGVYVDLSRMMAESWISELRAVHTQQGKVRLYLGMDNFPQDEPPIRVTIVEVPEATRKDAVSGPIVVEAEDARHTIDSSVFYNCIKGRDTTPTIVVSNGGFSGWNNEPPPSENVG